MDVCIFFKAFHFGNIFVKWFMQLSGDWKHSGVKEHRVAISFFFPSLFHGVAMATMSMRDSLIINISLPPPPRTESESLCS